MALKNKAMLVRLHISQWEGRKFDKKVTAEVEANHQVTDVGRWNKILLDKDALKDITNVHGRARDVHYLNTLPWRDDGARILPAAHFLEYSKKMQELREEYRQAVEILLSDYEEYIERAKVKLATMFDPADYPSTPKLKSKFSFSIHFDPLPEAADFRVSLNDAEVEEIKKSITERNDNAFKDATKELWVRLHKVVKHMADKLEGDSKTRLFESMIGNIQELVAMLPQLNFEDDQELEKIRKEVEEKLCRYDVENLRKDPEAKKEAAKEAKEILDAMAGFMS